MSNPLRSKKRGNTIIWILVGMLILGLGGFGATNFGGTVRSIGSVGDKEIDLRDYARLLQREMNALSAQIGRPVTFQEAQTLGLDRQVQARMFASAALDDEAARIGLSIGDEEVGRRILGIEAFQGIDGTFDREAYKLALQREGLTEAEFEERLREEAARFILQDAVMGATVAPQVMVDRLAAWVHETRSFTLAELTASDLPEPVGEPGEDDIRAYYEAHPDLFTAPETRQITYIWLTPEMLRDEVEIDEEAIRKLYEDRIDEFVTPERRLVDRLVYPDEQSATEAKARLEAGEATFEDLAAERGLTLSDIDLGEVTRDDLGNAADAVFALTEPGVVGPIQTDLGPALFAMNGILDAREVPFEEARDELAGEALLDRARRVIADRMDQIEDLLASGASLEEVAQETGMKLGQIAYAPDSEDEIAGYSAFREAAEKARTEDFPALESLEDGGIFALRLDRIDPPALRPMEEVRDEVIAYWRREETLKRLRELAAEIEARVAEGTPLSSTGLVTTRYEHFRRNGFLSGAPQQVVERVFSLSKGQTAIVDDGETVFVVAVDDIHAADPEDEELRATREALDAQIAQAIGTDMLQAFTAAVQEQAGINLNTAALNAVHAQLN
ncbi:peptidyl-prolyl cis-trans isomerase D [Albidovulum inexpectatum]|uniref:Parvulin-like PPIase n=1 Tax=Albidovulum inexpectatum TaxID=196587 RepID=A0A2S5JJR7_9RHOB|nr:peptidyl-prolyl cis-trans isomerase [Albidovulum inexpectatum]PPB81683.1 peptidyl-prolyl cis-trans isomerase D [Albidovulum inexpectatum]